MPPHRGHCYLIDFARNYCPDLTIFVCTLASESIPGELRIRWMQELYPTVRMVHITEEIPEAARSAKGAQSIWARSILRHVDAAPQYVFASEAYGVELAAELGSQFVPVDPQRSIFPISAGMIRENPFAHWEFIPPNVRPYFVRRISVVADDPEVIRTLAAQFETIYVTDYFAHCRRLSLAEPAISAPADILAAQAASEAALLYHANRVLFLETDLLRSIFASNDGNLLARLENRAYEKLIETSKPHLVLAFSRLDPRYRAEIARRGWVLREVDPERSNRESEAASIVHSVLQSKGGSG